MKEKAFTLIEILIVIGVLSTLTIALLTLLDPLELINRSQDVAMIATSKEVVDGVYRYDTSTNQLPFTEEVKGIALVENQNQEMIQKLRTNEDLKNDSFERIYKYSSSLFFTGDIDLSHVVVCFIPKSKNYKSSTSTVYDKFGYKTDCIHNTCYLCVGAIAPSSASPSQIDGSSSDQTECTGFDPEKPEYPFTCNSSSKWSQYKCTNYCVADLGCDSFCPSGQRHLRKGYYAIGSPDFETCLSNENTTKEDYCVSGATANCLAMPYASSDSDFLWGCSAPRRPYAWK